MVEYNSNNSDENDLSLIFHALSDQTRRSLLNDVSSKPMRVTDLAKNYDVSLNAISKHLKVLEKAKLINRNIAGRVHFCESNPDELGKVEEWLETYQKFWTDKLEKLEEFVNQKSHKKEKK